MGSYHYELQLNKRSGARSGGFSRQVYYVGTLHARF